MNKLNTLWLKNNQKTVNRFTVFWLFLFYREYVFQYHTKTNEAHKRKNNVTIIWIVFFCLIIGFVKITDSSGKNNHIRPSTRIVQANSDIVLSINQVHELWIVTMIIPAIILHVDTKNIVVFDFETSNRMLSSMFGFIIIASVNIINIGHRIFAISIVDSFITVLVR